MATVEDVPSEETRDEYAPSDHVVVGVAAVDPARDDDSETEAESQRTLKDSLLKEDAANVKLSPVVQARIASALTPTMRLIADQQSSAARRAMRAVERSGALRSVKLTQDALAAVKVPEIRIPALENLKMNLDASDRLRVQVVASLPTAHIDAQLAPLRATIAKSALPKIDLKLPTIPSVAFSKIYGREWAPIASKLANIQKLYEGIDFDWLFAGWFPPNWDRDRGVQQYHDFIELAETETLPLTWVPNTELTYALVDAESAEKRAALLVEHSTIIVADCRDVLDDFEHDSHLVTGLRTALDAYEAGFHGPAQSYAASILDTAIREAFTGPERWSYPKVKRLLHSGKDWRSLAVRSARLLPTSVALRGLLEDFWTDRGDPIPTTPNRHASAHAVHPDQYNQVNAIKFLMLATAMLAEMEYDGWTRILSAPSAAS